MVQALILLASHLIDPLEVLRFGEDLRAGLLPLPVCLDEKFFLVKIVFEVPECDVLSLRKAQYQYGLVPPVSAQDSVRSFGNDYGVDDSKPFDRIKKVLGKIALLAVYFLV